MNQPAPPSPPPSLKLRDLPRGVPRGLRLRPQGAGAGLADQPPPHRGAGAADAGGGHTAGAGGLHRRAHRGCRGGRERAMATPSRRCCNWWLLEGVAVAMLALCQRALSCAPRCCASSWAFGVNSMILEKALHPRPGAFRGLGVLRSHDARAPRGLGSGRCALVMRSFSLVQNLISLVSYAVLLFHFSPWAVLLLAHRGAACVRRRDASSPTTPSGCSAGARPSAACRPTWRPCSRARTTPRR